MGPTSLDFGGPKVEFWGSQGIRFWEVLGGFGKDPRLDFGGSWDAFGAPRACFEAPRHGFEGVFGWVWGVFGWLLDGFGLICGAGLGWF